MCKKSKLIYTCSCFCKTNNLVSRCQRGFLKDIQLGQTIARNTALSENVFMMAICTELRIPLFVVGKPGSSKSLAKDVISTNMKAGNSQSELFKNLKQVWEYLILHGSNQFIASLRSPLLPALKDLYFDVFSVNYLHSAITQFHFDKGRLPCFHV